MNTPTINPAHRYAVYEYTDKVSDPYYIGKRFWSGNGAPGPNQKIVLTSDSTEECIAAMDHSPKALFDWFAHQDAQTGGALGRMLSES